MAKHPPMAPTALRLEGCLLNSLAGGRVRNNLDSTTKGFTVIGLTAELVAAKAVSEVPKAGADSALIRSSHGAFYVGLKVDWHMLQKQFHQGKKETFSIKYITKEKINTDPKFLMLTLLSQALFPALAHSKDSPQFTLDQLHLLPVVTNSLQHFHPSLNFLGN